MDTLNPEAAIYNPALPLIDISPSPTSPRKRFDPAALAELTASIKAKGVLQPVIVRPPQAALGDPNYELVVGERRYRASIAAGLKTIPATIRCLSDVEVLEIQIIENDQREDIVAKIGKSRTYVYNRFKLLDLCPEGRIAFFDSKIDQSRAQMIARLGHHDTQRAALKDLTKLNYAGEPVYSARAARQHIEREYMLQLKNAPFDIKISDYTAKEKIIAGACAPCPKRSGNSPELFGDVSGTDVCTDVKCFHAKRSAAEARVEAKFITQGLKVITGKEAAKIIPNQWSNNATGDYVSENQTPPESELSYGKIAGKNVQPIMVKRDGHSEYVKVYPLAELKKLMQEKGTKPAKSSDVPREKSITQQNNHIAKFDLDARVRKAAYTAVRAHIATGLTEEDWRMVAQICVDVQTDYEFPMFTASLYAPESADEAGPRYGDTGLIIEALAKLPMAAIPRFICDVLLNDILETGRGSGPDSARYLDALFARHKIDTKAVRARLIAEDKAAAKLAAAKEKSTKTPSKPVTPEINKPLLIPGNELGEKLVKKMAKKK